MALPVVLLALALVPLPAVAVVVTHASGTVLVEGEAPTGSFSCYARTALQLWDGGGSFVLDVAYLPGSQGVVPCPWTTPRGGPWAGAGAEGDSAARDGSILVVTGERVDAEGPYVARTALEFSTGTIRLTQEYWRPGQEGAPFHVAAGLLAASDVAVRNDSP